MFLVSLYLRGTKISCRLSGTSNLGRRFLPASVSILSLVLYLKYSLLEAFLMIVLIKKLVYSCGESKLYGKRQIHSVQSSSQSHPLWVIFYVNRTLRFLSGLFYFLFVALVVIYLFKTCKALVSCSSIEGVY